MSLLKTQVFILQTAELGLAWSSARAPVINADYCAWITGNSGVISTCLVSSIKVEVKKKHLSNGWRFSCFAAHFIEQDLF
jgi:hypothetical protein